MLPRAYRVHRLAGRIRLKVPDRRKDAQWFTEAAQRLQGLAGVEGVEVAPITGSLLIRCEDSERLEAQLAQTGLFELAHGPAHGHSAPGPAVGSAALFGQQTGPRTLDSADLRTLLALLFVVLAIVQIVRGQILVPAISLLWYAATLALGPVGPLVHNDNGPPEASVPPQ